MKLRQKNTSSQKPVPIAGSQLTPIRLIGHTQRKDGKAGSQVWDCKCSCGRVWAAQKDHLTNGRQMMCGICKDEKRRLEHAQ